MRPAPGQREAKLSGSGDVAHENERYSFLLVADVAVHRESLGSMLNSSIGCEVCLASAATASSVLETFPRDRSRFVLLDLPVANGTDAARDLLQADPDVYLIAISTDEADAVVLAWAAAGVRACVPKDVSLEGFCEFIGHTIRERPSCSPQMADVLFRHFARLTGASEPVHEVPELTRREQEVLLLLAEHRSNKEIALALGVHVTTVKNHLHNIFGKLGIHGRGEAAEWSSLYAVGLGKRIEQPTS